MAGTTPKRWDEYVEEAKVAPFVLPISDDETLVFHGTLVTHSISAGQSAARLFHSQARSSSSGCSACRFLFISSGFMSRPGSSG